MTAIDLDPRIVAWLREDQPSGGSTVLAAVVDHARRHPHWRGRRASRPAWTWPGLGWSSRGLRLGMALSGAALAVAVIGGLYLGLPRHAVGPGSSPTASAPSSETPSSSPTQGAVSASLDGTWFGSDGNHTVLLTLRDCSSGGDCGTFERIDGGGEPCPYGLSFRAVEGQTLEVTTARVYPEEGVSFNCGYSPWVNALIEITQVHEDVAHVRVTTVGLAGLDILLERAVLREPGSSMVPSPSTSPAPSPTGPTAMPGVATRLPAGLTGTWMSTQSGPAPLLVTLRDCTIGQTCGVLERIDDNGEHCIYALRYDSSGDGRIGLTTGPGNSFGCGYSGWSSSRFGLRSLANALQLQAPWSATFELVRAAL